MLSYLRRRWRGSSSNTTFDPSQLDDPIAARTEWAPARRGGASFRTRHLVEIDSHRLEFRASAVAVLFYVLFLVMGVVALVVFFAITFAFGEPSRRIFILIPLVVGAGFVCVGGGGLYFGTAPLVFDKRMGLFWRGRRTPSSALDRGSAKDCVFLEDIHALQLISEYCRGENTSYYSYELNLVLEDGKRINVVDHGDQLWLQVDAGRLSSFLNKPVWDAT